MSRWRSQGVLFVTLLVFWVLLNGTMAQDVLLVGLAAAAVITLMFGQGLAVVSELRLTPRALWTAALYVPYFAKELVKSNIALARVVLSPNLPINPGIVKVKTKLKSPMGRLLLSSSITLTPGTLTVDLVGEWLYVHWVNVTATDAQAATAAIVSGFEDYLEVMYG